MQLQHGAVVHVEADVRESEAVKYAVRGLKRDLRLSLDADLNPELSPALVIRVGTVEVLEREHREKLCSLFSEDEKRILERREAFVRRRSGNVLWIAGADRRGTVYGVYDFCERVLGVSPWTFFADVPVRTRRFVEVPEEPAAGFPGIPLRGIFINDEEELEHWVQRYMGEDTIGVKTYERIFELLLRLKFNALWPAMHVNSFNMRPENGALAERMGIIVGTSHCDMLMRSNNREWKPWLASKGYEGVKYDFSIPGRNREILLEYWRESVEQNRNNECMYTMGMRGIHDSGLEAESLKGLRGEELLLAKRDLLQQILEAQEQILEETLGRNVTRLFIPYKEVLPLYDRGLAVPEDVTIVWANDNYGYVRRYPDAEERKRPGGHGIYYHNSYWAAPGASYLFVDSIPLAHTKRELEKAYEQGIRTLWITNFGAIKPLEMEMTFFADLAWDIGVRASETDDPKEWVRGWINRTFSGNFGGRLAPVLTEYAQLMNTRKIEQMDAEAFSQSAYGNEAAMRVNRSRRWFDEGNAVWQALPPEERDAFFQLVLMKLHAAYWTGRMYYYADRSNHCMEKGQRLEAEEACLLSREAEHARRAMLYYYGHVMSNGKWRGILTPEDYPPPRTSMDPACCPPIEGVEVKPLEETPEKNGAKRITMEASDCFPTGAMEVPGWKRIPYLGRGQGDAAEAEEEGYDLSARFVLPVRCMPLLELHRFPTLDATGRIRVRLRIDAGPEILLETEAVDEHRGKWKENLRDGVDRLACRLPLLEAGEHTFTLTSVDRYFTFSRIVLYIGPRLENNLGFLTGNDGEPEALDCIAFAERMYSRASVELPPRPELFLDFRPGRDTLENRVYARPREEDGTGCLQPADIVRLGKAPAAEKNGVIYIEAGAALADTPDAVACNGPWRYCLAPTHGGHGLAMYLRTGWHEYPSDGSEPVLMRRFVSEGGIYRIYVCMMTWMDNTGRFATSIDGQMHDPAPWSYAGEQVYLWIPAGECSLAPGVHTFALHAYASAFRFAQARLVRCEPD